MYIRYMIISALMTIHCLADEQSVHDITTLYAHLNTVAKLPELAKRDVDSILDQLKTIKPITLPSSTSFSTTYTVDESIKTTLKLLEDILTQVTKLTKEKINEYSTELAQELLRIFNYEKQDTFKQNYLVMLKLIQQQEITSPFLHKMFAISSGLLQNKNNDAAIEILAKLFEANINPTA